MKKINIYFGKSNAENVVLFENISDKKVVIMGEENGYFDSLIDLYDDNAIENLKEYCDKMINENNFNSFYNMSESIYNLDVLEQYEIELIATYYE
jgi:hypothetical protein